jgi:anti-sigma28 factor (negative regulator of flagellin synthesis)
VRMSVNPLIRTFRAAAPAPAREVIRAQSESQATTDATGDTAGGGTAIAISPRELRIAELRRLVQEGRYEVNAEEVSASIVKSHLRPAR